MNIDKDDETDDATAEPAKRIPGADFEPGPSSPLNDDGSPKWSATAAYGRYSEATIRNEQAEAARRRAADMAVWFPNGPEGDE